jgi:transcription initiation factor TFIID subunit 6
MRPYPRYRGTLVSQVSFARFATFHVLILVINAAHWLAIEGVQPSIPQNPTTAEARSQELLSKGPNANPALAALAGNDNLSIKPAVKHIVSKELVLYFDKIQAAVLDENPDEEVMRLREAALESVRTDPGLHQLVPYFVNFIANQVTHRMDDVFVLRQMMELTAALIANPNLYLDPYASPLCAPVLTCLMSRKLGADDGADAVREQFLLREMSASLLGTVARRYARSNNLLRPKLTRTCLKAFLDPTKPAPVLFGAICGLSSAGGAEAVRILVLPNLRHFDAGVLQPLQERGAGSVEFETLVEGGIMKAIKTLVAHEPSVTNGFNGVVSDTETAELIEFLGPTIGSRIARLNDRRLNRAVLEVKHLE